MNRREEWSPPDEIQEIAQKFILADCLNPEVVAARFEADKLSSSG